MRGRRPDGSVPPATSHCNAHQGNVPIAPLPTQPAGQHEQSFPRQLRLLHGTEFDTVFQNGQRSADRFFTILFNPNLLNRPRLGFAISKQKVHLAVGRNRLRRLVRESFRLRAAGLPAVDLVVLARDGAKAAPSGALVASLEKHWVRVIAGASKPIGQAEGHSTGKSIT